MIRRAADFSAQEWEHESRAKADFLADKFEEECKRRGVNPEHPRLGGYVVMDGKVPRLVIKTERIGGGLGEFQRFNRNQIPKAVDFAHECASWLEKLDQSEEGLARIEERFKESFEVRREPGSAELLISPKADDRLRMSAGLYCFLWGAMDEKTDQLDATRVNLKLEVTLSLESTFALCEEALHNAKGK